LQKSGTYRVLAATPALLTLLWAWSPASGEALAGHASSSGRSTETATEWFAAVAGFIRPKWPQLSATQQHSEASARTCLQRLDWLDRKFRTKAFRKGLRNCGEGHADSAVNDGWPQIGIFVIEFPTCRLLAAVQMAVEKSRRTTFRLLVATVFRAISRGRTLIFVSSESVLREDVGLALAALDSFAADRKECTDASP
jgi:hypothetical protein